MKYIFLNLKSFFSDSKLVAILAIISTLISSIVINFSYGIYQNYNVIIEKDMTEGYDTMSVIFLNYGEEEGEYVTQEMFMECIYEIAGYSSKMDEKIVVLGGNGIIDGYTFDFRFGIRNGKISVSDSLIENSRINGMLSGEYWSDTDECMGSLYALCFDYHTFDNDTPYLDSMIVDENTLLIDGKEYEIIGYQSWTDDGAVIPIMSVNESTYMKDSFIMFDQNISRKTYEKISETFTSRLGDFAYVKEIPVLDKDSYYTYRTVIIIAVLITLIAALNFIVLYKYILNQRRKKTAIYRLCGLTSGKMSVYNLIECMTITIPLYITGIILYKNFLLPRLSIYFPYMADAYTDRLYLVLFLVYVFISLIVCFIFIIHDNAKKITVQIKG